MRSSLGQWGTRGRVLKCWKSLENPTAFRQAQLKVATADPGPSSLSLWHPGSHFGEVLAPGVEGLTAK